MVCSHESRLIFIEVGLYHFRFRCLGVHERTGLHQIAGREEAVQLQRFQHRVDLIKDEEYLFDKNKRDSSVDESEPQDFESWNLGHIFASTRSN
jgi:hypothetical protein